MTAPAHPQRCTPNDIDAISQYIDKYKDKELFFYSKATIKRMVLGDNEGRKPYDIFLEKIDNQIVGIAIVSSKSKTLSLLFVSPEYRKNGIGTALFNTANPKQILMKRNAVPYFARLCNCASHSSVQSRDQVLDEIANPVIRLSERMEEDGDYISQSCFEDVLKIIAESRTQGSRDP